MNLNNLPEDATLLRRIHGNACDREIVAVEFPDKCVTWQVSSEGDFFWGHYFESGSKRTMRDAAIADFWERSKG